MRRLTIVILPWLGALACVSDVVPRPGEERAICKKDDRCDPRLECWSDRCVRPPPADCRAVGERLAAAKLGNYASREEREPVVAGLAVQCERAQLSRPEGRCLLEAGTENELAACPFPLLPELSADPEGCAKVGARAAELVRAGAAGDDEMAALLPVIDRVPTTITALCVAGRWSMAAKTCMIEATAVDAASGCIDQLDDDDRRALDQQMEALIDGARTGSSRSTAGMPSECKAYLGVLASYAACEKLPAEARAAIKQGMAAMETTWSQVDGDQRRSVDDSCRQGAQAMRDAMTAMGCTPPAVDPWE